MSNDTNDDAATIEVRWIGDGEWEVSNAEGVQAEVLYTVTDMAQNSEMKIALRPNE